MKPEIYKIGDVIKSVNNEIQMGMLFTIINIKHGWQQSYYICKSYPDKWYNQILIIDEIDHKMSETDLIYWKIERAVLK